MKCMNGKRGLPRAVALASVLVLVGAGCKSPSGKGANGEVVRQALAGKDGACTVDKANTIVNAYSALTANANVGASAVTVNAIAELASNPCRGDGGLQPLAAGDLLLIIQMAGATINATDTSAYGDVGTTLNNAGNYELAGVASISGSTIALDCALKNSYTLTGKAQVIRVPQYTTLTVAAGTTDASPDPNAPSITAPTWNGTVGGVVAVQAATTLQLDGTINVSGKGFRGGAVHTGAASGTTDLLTYRSNLGTAGGQKGESIAGAPADYDNLFSGQYGRGAPANGGGGGNWHNGGGGGGANAAASGLTWNGQGVMLHSDPNDALAWALDPGYALGGDFTNSSGGGRGGYTYSANNQEATVNVGATAGPPGAPAWGGNYRRERGGLGGHPLASSPAGKLFLGGGGGAGDGNDGFTGPGGNGGGMVFAIAGTVKGGGKILANGADGSPANSTGTSGDGPGGGGGGGTVVVHADTALSEISVAANGGKGGSQHIAGTFEAEGPGGGGGGGYVALSGGTAAAVLVNGGPGGTTDSTGLTEFPSNGASTGHVGVADGDATTLQYCSLVLDTTITSAPARLTNQSAVGFTFSSPQSGVTFECSLDGALPYVACECRLDGGTYGLCAASYTTPANLTDGTHTLDVRAKDGVGNVDDTSAHYDWLLDTVAPQTYILTGPADAGTSTTGQFTFSSDETSELGVSYQCRLDSTDAADFATCPANYTISGLADGSHTLDVRAKDAAGNVDPTPASYTWEVHLLGLDGGVEDAAPDGEATDGLGDAGELDAGPNTADGPGTVVLPDARPDVTAADRAPDTSRDVSIVGDARADAPSVDAGTLDDAMGDAGGLDADAKDAQVVVVVDPPSADAAVTPDRPVALPPDSAAATTRDAPAVVPPTPDAPVVVVTETGKIMGSGFCAVNPVRDSAPGLFTLFLVGAFGLLLRRRRR
jgi:hypothetical protein